MVNLTFGWEMSINFAACTYNADQIYLNSGIVKTIGIYFDMLKYFECYRYLSTKKV